MSTIGIICLIIDMLIATQPIKTAELNEVWAQKESEEKFRSHSNDSFRLYIIYVLHKCGGYVCASAIPFDRFLMLKHKTGDTNAKFGWISNSKAITTNDKKGNPFQ